MKQQGILTTWIRILIAAAMALALGLAISVAAPASVVSAANVAPSTAFVIDGDRLGPNDFAAPYGPGTTPGGFPTTGIYYNRQSFDENLLTGGCAIVNDPSTGNGGVKLGDGPIWATGGADPNGKTDLNYIELAAEKVDANGEIFDIVYVGYHKCGGQGTWQAALYLDDGDGIAPSAGDNGDYLFIFDFNPSSGAVTFLQYRRVAGAWVQDTGSNSAFIDGKASGDYGEVALNVTELVFNDDAGVAHCGPFIVSGPAAAITGGSLQSQVKDLIAFPPLRIDNCGALAVRKASPATSAPSDLFTYSFDQGTTNNTHDGTLGVSGIAPPASTTEPDANLNEVDATITVGQTHTWSRVIQGRDYALTETLPVPPAGWQLQSIVCTAPNIFKAGYPVETFTIYTAGAYTGTKFHVPPATIGNTTLQQASCVMTNDVAGIVVAKQTQPGGAATSFPFTVTGGGTTATPSLTDGQSQFVPLAPGTSVTITEGSVGGSPAWNATDITCRTPDGSIVATGDLASRSVTVTSGSVGNTITCTFTNTRNGTITIDKAGNPADSPQAFDFTVDGSPAGSITIAGAPIVVEVAPGDHTVAELEPPFDSEWSLTDIACGNEVSENLAGQSVVVAVAPGANVNCTFTNNQRGPVDVVKSAVLLDPAPVPGTIDQFDVRYTVIATSSSFITENITVTDAFAFPAALTVVGAPSVSGAASTAGWNGTSNTNLYTGPIGPQGELTWTIDVRVALDLDAPAADRDCDAAGSGAWNDVIVAVQGGGFDVDDACIPFGGPEIAVDKSVVGAVTVNPDLSMSVTYRVDVGNAGDGPGSYELADGFGFPAWVSVDDVSVTPPAGVSANPGYDGDVDTAVTTGPVGIGADGLHSYLITVTFTAVPTATDAGVVCGGEPGSGLFNLASITSTSGPGSAEACIDIPRGRLTVTKATFGGTGTFDFQSTVPGALIDGQSITTTTGDGVASGNTLSAHVTPGTYSVTETVPAGWTAIAAPCGDGIAVADGAAVSCDFQNGRQGSITVNKIATPAGSFDFTLSPGSTQSVSSGATPGYTWTGLDAGDYTLTETVPAGWFLADAACDGAAFTNGGTISLGWGETVTCTYTDEAFAEIVVAKVTDPVTDPATLTFGYTGAVPGPLGHGQTASTGLVLAGDYVVNELAKAGWDLTNLVCASESLVGGTATSTWTYGGDATFDDGDTAAQIALAAGDRVTCTFTNTQRGQIVVHKAITDGTAVGAALLQTFGFDLTGDFATAEAFTLDGNGDDTDGTQSSASFEVRPGGYAVAETLPANWALAGVVCTGGQDPSDLTVAPGATVECTFTNQPDPADVSIEKSVVNVASDYAWSFDFTITPAPLGQNPTKQAAGVGPSSVEIGWTDLIPGEQYTITENVPANWTQTGLVCVGLADLDGDTDDNSVTFVATPGLSLACSVTNTPDNPTITVVKTTVGDAGTFAFTVTPENAEDDPIGFNLAVAADASEQSATYELLSGLTYAVDETDPGSAWAEGSLDCGSFGLGVPGTAVDVTVAPGDDVVCRITNSALGTITIVKSTSGADGTFSFTMNGEPFTIVTSSGSGQEDFMNLAPGTYTVVETDPTANFDGTNLVCVSSNGDVETIDVSTLTATIELSNGESVVCTFTNTERAHIVVDKVTNPGGDLTEFTFSHDFVAGGGSFGLADAGAPVDSGPIPSNTTYTLTEEPQAGWVVTGFDCVGGANDVVYDVDVNDADGASASITPRPGETILCTVTNNLRGPVTIDKVANPASISRDGEIYTVVYELTVGTESFITEPFTLTDTPDFATDADIVSVVVTDASAAVVSLPLDGTIDPGEELVYTVTIDFTIDGDVSLLDRICGGPGSASYNGATVTFGVAPGTASSNDCVGLPVPDMSVTKAPVAAPAQPVYVGGNAYTVSYEIVVTNDGEGTGSYDLTEAPSFGGGITITDISATSTDGAVNALFGLGDPQLAVSVDLPAGASDTYVVTVAFTIDGGATLAARDCAGPGTASYNSVSLVYNGVAGTPANACVDLPDPELTIVKAVAADQPELVGDNVYTATYTVTVDNVGDGPGAYDLVDTPDFGAGATVTNVAVTGNGVAIDQPGSGPVTIVTGETIDPDELAHVYTVVVTFEVDGSMTADARTCATGEERAGFGAFNGAEVTYNDDQVVRDDDCADIPEPDVSIDKSLDDANPLTLNDDGTWTLGYLLTVSNAAGAGPADYDLTDTFVFTDGVTVEGVRVVVISAEPDASALTPGFDGDAQPEVAAGVRIDDGESHVYRILVDLTIDPVATTEPSCQGEGGLANEMRVSVRGEEPLFDATCDSFSILTLIKEVSNDDGGEATEDDFTLTATGDGTVLEGTTPVEAVVPAGVYELSETQLDGYASEGWSCGPAETDGSAVFVADGSWVICTIVNDDRPVDLELTKTDGGFEAIAGGPPIPYTITVRNVGSRDADLGEPVTVTDELPAFLSWATVPANCTPAGQVLTCTIDPAAMTAGGPAVTIQATVNVAPDAPSGDYENRAWVDTEDDPVCVGAECVPPPCTEAAANNNLDCEITPVDRFATITIVKTDDVADGASVRPGDTFAYNLVVTNNGPSSILPGLVVDDDLPTQLELVSVAGGAGWTCNSADPIECTYGPGIAPGASTTAITVGVRVALGATGTSITNVAVAIGAVDRDCPTVPSALAESHVSLACNQVMDDDDEITPLLSNADLAIEKTASQLQVGAGGAFTFQLDVVNNGPAPAQNVVVGDIVPAPLVVTAVSSTFFTCSNAGNDVSCTRPSMAVGATGSITVSVSVPAAAASSTVNNIGTVQSSTPDPNLDNNSDDASVDIVAQAPPTTAPLPPVTLPRTGSDATGDLVRTAFVLLVIGAGVVLVARRRPEAAED